MIPGTAAGEPAPPAPAASRVERRSPLHALVRLALDPGWQGALLAGCAVLVLFARAGWGPLPNYDDAYYAEKAKQMLRAHAAFRRSRAAR